MSHSLKGRVHGKLVLSQFASVSMHRKDALPLTRYDHTVLIARA